MMKRKRSDEASHARCYSKRQRTGCHQNLCDLSDEILLRILSFLDVQQLTTIERVSHRLRRLASDSEVWKAKFFDRWIASRTRRMPQETIGSDPSKKLMQWLETGRVSKDVPKADWKRQYKLRSNWDRGAAKFHELEVAKPPAPPVLARVHRGLVLTIDSTSGLRVWSQKCRSKHLQAHVSLDSLEDPTSFAVDGTVDDLKILVGFRDGSLKLYHLTRGMEIKVQVEHRPKQHTAITGAALAMPYAATISADRHIQIYHLMQEAEREPIRWSASLLTSLHADSPLHPATLGLRCAPRTIVTTISYAFHRLNAGWCLGLQEIRLGAADGSLRSRLTSNMVTPLDARYMGKTRWDVTSRSAYSTPISSPFALQPYLKSAPNSLSYSHPYLLASLADNTIMSYIVTSTEDELEINTGRRLWGHTSAVLGAEVSNRGKAVSVSAKGEEIRVWELEDAFTTNGKGRSSVQVQPNHAALDIVGAVAKRGDGLGLALREMKRELAFTRRWVGFDEEQVVVMGHRDDRQIMACYDFT